MTAEDLPPPAPPARRKPRVGEAAQAVGRQLRTAYDDVLSEPVPQHLTDLLAQLKAAAEPKP